MEQSQERKALWILASIQFTNVLDFLIMMPLGPQFMRIFAISPARFGLLVSAYAISAGVAGLVAAFGLDQFDRRRSLLVLYAGFVAGTALCGLAPSFAWLLCARIVTGAFGGVTGAVVLAIVADLVPESRRGAALGLVMSAFSVASIIGVPLGLFLATHFGWHWTFLGLAAVSVPIWLGAARSLPQIRSQRPRAAAGERWSELSHVITNKNHLWAYALMAMLVFAGFSVIPYLSPFMVKNVGLSEKHLPLIYLFGGLSTIFTMNWIGRLADRYGKFRLLAIMASASAAATLLVTSLPPLGPALVIAATTSFMVASSGRFVPAMALITAAVDPRYRGSFMSLNASVQHLFSGAAAFAAGLVIGESAQGRMTRYSLVGLFSSGCALACIVIAHRLSHHSQQTRLAREALAEIQESTGF